MKIRKVVLSICILCALNAAYASKTFTIKNDSACSLTFNSSLMAHMSLDGPKRIEAHDLSVLRFDFMEDEAFGVIMITAHCQNNLQDLMVIKLNHNSRLLGGDYIHIAIPSYNGAVDVSPKSEVWTQESVVSVIDGYAHKD